VLSARWSAAFKAGILIKSCENDLMATSKMTVTTTIAHLRKQLLIIIPLQTGKPAASRCRCCFVMIRAVSMDRLSGPRNKNDPRNTLYGYTVGRSEMGIYMATG
jgi:hypothetical protein